MNMVKIMMAGAMAMLLLPSLVTNIWQAVEGGSPLRLIRRLWRFLLPATLAVWVGLWLARDLETAALVRLLGLLLVPVTNDGSSFSGQLIGAATIFGWVFVASLVTWGIIKAIIGIRVSEEEEYEGVDLSECGMEAYPEFTQQ